MSARSALSGVSRAPPARADALQPAQAEAEVVELGDAGDVAADAAVISTAAGVRCDIVKRIRRPPAIIGLAVAMAALAGVPAAHAGVGVTFVAPERFADIGFMPADRREVLERLDAHLRQWGTRHLRDGEMLALDLLDVDLAGEVHPGPRDHLRVLLGGTDGPRIHLRYELRVGTRVVGQGDERLTDPFYLERRTSVRTDEALFYERRMLDDWLASRIVPTLAAAR